LIKGKGLLDFNFSKKPTLNSMFKSNLDRSAHVPFFEEVG